MISTADEYRAWRAIVAPTAVTSPVAGPIAIPCLSSVLVARTMLVANTYNPNHVSADKMGLLYESIKTNGFCFPIVTIWDPETEKLVIIDGFHRWLISGPDWLDLPAIPVVVLDHDIAQRMAATIQFNKARGVHQVDLDAEVIRALLDQGLTAEDVAQRLSLELEAVHRYKQVSGVAALFANVDWSQSWQMRDDGT